MARFVSAVLLCGSVAISTGVLAQVDATDPANLPVINGRVTPGQFRGLLFEPALKRCIDARCKALRSLILSYDELRRFNTPNTMARSENNPPPRKRPRLPVQDAISTDASQGATILGDLVIIGRDVPDWSTEMLTIEIATLTDASGQTVRRVIDTIPKTPALAGIVDAARARCEVNREHGCNAIEDAG